MKGGSEGFQGEISRMIQDRIRQAHEGFEHSRRHGQKDGERLRKQIAERLREAERHINEKIKEEDQVLYNHLMKTKVIVVVSTDKLNEHCDYKKYKNLPLRPFFTWFIRFYAGIIHEQFLIK